jgi:NAD(P)-dependent dehydrogenase (short-subunit alcohol dehydrogenase family)
MNQNYKPLAGKVALVTGGSAGIGFGTAKKLIEAGAYVYIVSRGKDKVDAAVRELGESAYGMAVDVSKKKDLEEIAEVISKKHGHLDILFANAGVFKPTPLDEMTESDIDTLLDVNIKGVIFSVQAIVPIMNDGGSIVINSSITKDMGLPDFSVYAATKAAIRSLARSWTTDLRYKNIRVNSISPGIIPTEVLNLSDQEMSEYVEKVNAEVPVGRVGKPEDVGNAVVFLSSNQNSFITGVDLVIDGGMTQIYAGDNITSF